jgi:hypothetical protein
MSRAGVLGGQLAEATEWPVRPSAWARFPEETLARDVIWFGKYPSGSGFEDGEHWFG